MLDLLDPTVIQGFKVVHGDLDKKHYYKNRLTVYSLLIYGRFGTAPHH